MTDLGIDLAQILRPLGADPCAALEGAAPWSGHLRRLASPERLARLARLGPEGLLDEACQTAMAIAAGEIDQAGARLRRAKADVHFACAGADLSGHWSLEEVTAALSRFADAAVQGALCAAAHALGLTRAGDPLGLVVLAMGKLGALELNYSSDIDLTVFYDAGAFGPDGRQRVVRLVQHLARLLEERSVDGYVFRVDLRLRPDPASNPVAVTLAAAEHYYQTLGQNWERAAFIKARQIAGDFHLGGQFLRAMGPFLWRKYLDFAAIADIRSIKRQIGAAAGNAPLDEEVFDLKRDRGGIRDIELLAQTQQLILGGRFEMLREPGTCAALAALARHGAIQGQEGEMLSACYRALRGVEHRLQMLEDEQTHAIPAQAQIRQALASLCGHFEFASLAKALRCVRAQVMRIDGAVFPADQSLADSLGSLSFTGVEDDPQTLITLHKLGFARAQAVTEAVRGWHHGRVRATRSQRARELLTEITPALLRAFAETGDADAAFQAFDSFFSRLPHGVQALSLFAARPWVLEGLLRACVAAPKLAAQLSARPAALDILLDWQARTSVEDLPAICADLMANARAAEDLETALNAARRVHRDESLRLALLLISGQLDGPQSGRAHASLADGVIAALLAAVQADFARRGRPFPQRVCVMGLGKLGGQELAGGSDLDLIMVYDAPGESGDGAARLTQALITALSVPTSEGPLYDIDMQIRPSGAKGPIAVRLSSFVHYYQQEAWTWELMALTRLRFIAGDEILARDVLHVAHGALARARDGAKQRQEILAMRAKMDQERPPHGDWDFKLAPGGLVDVEFAVQARLLLAARRTGMAARAHLADAIEDLQQGGFLAAGDAGVLLERWRRLTILRQIKRAAWPGHFEPARAPRPLLDRMAAALGDESFEVSARLHQQGAMAARALCLRLIAQEIESN